METMMTLVSISFFLLVVRNIITDFQLRKAKKLIDDLASREKALMEALEDQWNDHRELMRFSLSCIIKDALEREDYETAQKCKEQIDRMNI